MTSVPSATVTESPAAAGAEASPTVSAGAEASPAGSGAPVPSPAASVAFSDLGNVFGADKIAQLAQLGVFQPAGGTFDPYKPIVRHDFVRWMFNANNAIFRGNDTLQLRPVTPADDSTFTDVTKTDPDFPYIQSLANAGVSVGFPDHTFRGDQPLTREQMVAMKETLDDGGPAATDPSKDIPQAYYQMAGWKDKRSVAPQFAWAVSEASDDNGSSSMHNVSRVYGAIAEFKPKKPVTRAEAALELWVLRPHNRYSSDKRSAADALGASPAP